ncbi:FAD-binding protein, partial [Nocardioides marmoraquaticus]
ALEEHAAVLGVPRLDAVLDALLLAGGQVVGVRAGGRELRARAVVLATGGLGHAYATTTNPTGVTGDGLALALLAGATLADVEFVQFHPTALWTGAAYGQVPLVTEALRGEGAVLRDVAGRAFMQGVHPLADLAPRDVVARAVHRATRRDGRSHVWLDTSPVPDVASRFPTVVAACRAHGIDPASIPVTPAEHYLCGGVVVDPVGATDVPGLYAVGEVAASGVHGANRLASNSLLEGLVLGRRLGDHLAAGLPRDARGSVEVAATAPATGVSARARDLLSSAGGLVRDAVGLADGRRALLAEPTREVTWLVAAAVLAAAEARRESRGAHLRSDAPEPLDWWRRRVLVRVDGTGVPQAHGDRRERAA